jgi:hypothetical protein
LSACDGSKSTLSGETMPSPAKNPKQAPPTGSGFAKASPDKPGQAKKGPAVGSQRAYANRRRGKKGGVAEENAYSREEAEKETESELEEEEGAGSEETDLESEEDVLDWDGDGDDGE